MSQAQAISNGIQPSQSSSSSQSTALIPTSQALTLPMSQAPTASQQTDRTALTAKPFHLLSSLNGEFRLVADEPLEDSLSLPSSTSTHDWLNEIYSLNSSFPSSSIAPVSTSLPMDWIDEIHDLNLTLPRSYTSSLMTQDRPVYHQLDSGVSDLGILLFDNLHQWHVNQETAFMAEFDETAFATQDEYNKVRQMFTSAKIPPYYIDSGCSKSMGDDKDAFLDIQPLPQSVTRQMWWQQHSTRYLHWHHCDASGHLWLQTQGSGEGLPLRTWSGM
ncbi:hypothetical protein BJ508DRAFT_335596 [Ascobolus immersus RN42]|uniref:Uncharacterized protein n=1 Tax=Ascobolus immersus RN42 TaxID=1160509 RepID=A0A3N4HIR9_ASCIM|nr:hypothetical protein BJ508DRAFT_335596 [Ascobolus immersus RN42]